MRLHEETEFRPKPMVEIGGRPILWHIMKTYEHYGCTDFILCLGYKGELIKHYFMNYHWLANDITVETVGETPRLTVHADKPQTPWRVTLVDTGAEAMTGARVKRVERYVSGDLFLLTYGDGVADIDLNGLMRFHKEHGKIGSVTGVGQPSRFGALQTRNDKVLAFNEKPETDGRLINGGFFAFNRGFFDYLEDDDSCVLEGPPLERLAQAGEFMTYEHRGFWKCMDTYRDYRELDDLCRSGKPPWAVWL